MFCNIVGGVITAPSVLWTQLPAGQDANIAFYEECAQRYWDNTIGIDLGPLYARFLVHVPAGGALLDAGCGSGRDAQWFRTRQT
jgi:hypothetical protein